jgi:hypothetical protein
MKHSSLDTYLSSLQSISGAYSWFFEAYRLIGQLRREIDKLPEAPKGQGESRVTDTLARELAAYVERVMSEVDSLSTEAIRREDSTELAKEIEQLTRMARAIGESETPSAAFSAYAIRESLQRVLNAMRNVRDSSIIRP